MRVTAQKRHGAKYDFVLATMVDMILNSESYRNCQVIAFSTWYAVARPEVYERLHYYIQQRLAYALLMFHSPCYIFVHSGDFIEHIY